MRFETKRLNTKLIQEYLKFFDDIAFCDNPEWSQCYCCHFYLPDENEVDTRVYCQKLIREGKLNGFLAFDDGVPVGWCNCDVITNYPRIMDNPYAAEIKELTVALVCFVVDPKRRREGIATCLIQAAIDEYSRAGYNWMDVSTMKEAKTDADNYYGPRRLYEKFGFKIVGENERFYLMRKAL